MFVSGFLCSRKDFLTSRVENQILFSGEVKSETSNICMAFDGFDKRRSIWNTGFTKTQSKMYDGPFV